MITFLWFSSLLQLWIFKVLISVKQIIQFSPDHVHKLMSAIKLTKINKQGSDISSRLTLMIFDTFAKPLKNYLNFQVDTNKCQFKKKLASITRIPANKYMLKVNNKNNGKRCGIKIKTPLSIFQTFS